MHTGYTVSRTAIWLGFTLLFATCVAAQMHAHEPQRSDKQWLSNIKLKAPQPQEQFAAYWSTEPGWHTEIQLRNNMPNQILTVTPVARTADGNEISLTAVTLQPNQVQSIDLAELLSKSGPQLIGHYGSLIFRYNSPFLRNLYAVAMVHDAGYPLDFHLDGESRAKKWKKGSREGIWWLPNTTATGYLIITNFAEHPVEATLTIYDATGKAVSQKIKFAPRNVERFSMRALIDSAGLSGSFGGVSIGATEDAGSLDSTGIIFDEAVGFGAVLKMFDHDPETKLEHRDFAKTGKWTTRAPMLALETPDPFLDLPQGTILEPQIFLRNTTGVSTKVTARLNWRSASATGIAQLPELTLSAHETRRIDIKSIQDSGAIPKNANWASVTLTSDTGPDDVMAVAASYDHTLRYGAQTPFSDQLSIHMEGGQWQVDATHNSLIAAGNGNNQPIRASLSFFYGQGKNQYTLERTLQPEEQMWIDIGQLIHNRVLDKHGNVLPADVTEGSYQLMEIEPQTLGSLYEGKVIVDKTFGHAAYGCMICCGVGSGQLSPNPWTGYIGFYGPGNVGSQDACSGGNVETTNYYGTWWTDNSSVATATYARFNGVGMGTANGYAQGLIPIGDGVDVGRTGRCPVMRDTPQQMTKVGKSVVLVGVNCNTNLLHYSGNWGDPNNLGACTITDDKTAGIPAGGQCVQGGTTANGTTVYSYQITTNNCTRTWTPVNQRTVDAGCSTFIDTGGFTETVYPAGCSQ